MPKNSETDFFFNTKSIKKLRLIICRDILRNLMSDPEKALALEMNREECKIRIRTVAAMLEEYPKIYAFLLGQMSEQS